MARVLCQPDCGLDGLLRGSHNNTVMFRESMNRLLIPIGLLLLIACSPGHEQPARGFQFPAEHLSAEQVTEFAVKVGQRSGLTSQIKDPEVMATLNDGRPTAFVWLNNGSRTVATVTTVKNNGMVLIWLYEAGLGSQEALDKLENDFHEVYVESYFAK